MLAWSYMALAIQFSIAWSPMIQFDLICISQKGLVRALQLCAVPGPRSLAFSSSLLSKLSANLAFGLHIIELLHSGMPLSSTCSFWLDECPISWAVSVSYTTAY